LEGNKAIHDFSEIRDYEGFAALDMEDPAEPASLLESDITPLIYES
jgi:hypothetical protein